MSDLISRQAATNIPILPKEHRKMFKSIDDAFETGWNEALSCVNMLPSAQPETAHKVKGKIKAGVTLWYSCDHCERPVDKYDAYCHCCGRRFVDE